MPFAEVYTGLETRTIDAQDTRSTSSGQQNFMKCRSTFLYPSRLFAASGGDQQSEV